MNHPSRNWRARLIAETGALPQNLVSAWLTLFPAQSRASRALYVHRRTGCACNPNLLAAWARGARATPERVQRLMRYELLLLLVGTDVADALSPVLEAPERRELPVLDTHEQ